MNLSRKCSDFSLSPLNIGGGTLDKDLLLLVVLFSAGGVGGVTVAVISSISMWGVAVISLIWAVAISSIWVGVISSGWVGAVVGYIICLPLWNCGSVSCQCPNW